MAYLVLSQFTQRPGGQEKYRDVEGSLYHYPQKYFGLIEGFEAFIYYRPQRNAPRVERSSYIGFGRLLDWFPDPTRTDHRYVRIADYRPFYATSIVRRAGRLVLRIAFHYPECLPRASCPQDQQR